MPTPCVSVLMTTYNGAATIGASIDSVLAQSFRDFELLVVDDGSTDDTPAILERIHDPRLRLLRTGSRGASLPPATMASPQPRGASSRRWIMMT